MEKNSSFNFYFGEFSYLHCFKLIFHMTGVLTAVVVTGVVEVTGMVDSLTLLTNQIKQTKIPKLEMIKTVNFKSLDRN